MQHRNEERALCGYQAVLLLLFFLGISWLATTAELPPAPLSVEAPPREFSADRAFSHLKVIAGNPRPSGSQANAAAREYLKNQLEKLGLRVEMQAFPLQIAGRKLVGTNVIAILPGHLGASTNRDAVALVCHHDSVSRGPGAGDDGAAVATLIETARAIKAGELLKHDLLFIFTDAEEANLDGARAFVASSPWLKRVGLVLNFDARGVSGPVYMFETSRGNGRLIEQLAQAAPRPAANSLMSEVYRHMPNDTDLTVFRQAGLPGLNFAFIGEAQYYHSAEDDIEHFSRATLQHQGTYALSLARSFGNADLGRLEARDAVYFDLGGRLLVRYPAAWAVALACAAGLFVLLLVSHLIRRREATVSQIMLGLVVWPVCLVLVGVACRFAPDVLGNLWSSRSPRTFGNALWFVGIVLTLAIQFAVCQIARRFLPVAALALSAWIWCAIMGIAIAIWLPGASYVILWPLIAAVTFAPFLLKRGRSPWSAWTGLLLSAVPAMVLVSPLVSAFYVALGPRALFVPMIVLGVEVALLALSLDAVLGTLSARRPQDGAVLI